MKQVLLLASHHEICFPDGAGRERIGKAGRYNRPAFRGLLVLMMWIDSTGLGQRRTAERTPACSTGDNERIGCTYDNSAVHFHRDTLITGSWIGIE